MDEIAEYRLAYLPDEIARAADEGGSASCGESVEDASYPGVRDSEGSRGIGRESWRSYHEHDPCYFPTKMARVFNIHVFFNGHITHPVMAYLPTFVTINVSKYTVSTWIDTLLFLERIGSYKFYDASSHTHTHILSWLHGVCFPLAISG